MSALRDSLRVRDAVTNQGHPLTLTEAGHYARISRSRAYFGTKYGVAEGGLSYVRVGVRFLIDNLLTVPPTAPAEPTVAADVVALNVDWLEPVAGDGDILAYHVVWTNLDKGNGGQTDVPASQLSLVVQNDSVPLWEVGNQLSVTVAALSIVGSSNPSTPGVAVVA